MSENQKNTFQIKSMTFPRIDSLFINPPSTNEFDLGYRVEGLVISPKNIRLLFGIRLASKDKVNEQTPKISVTVEAIGDFEFGSDLPTITKITDVPLAGNMLALMYPFIREKIYSCLANNNFQYYLPPANTLQLIKDHEKDFKIVDKRGSLEAQPSSP